MAPPSSLVLGFTPLLLLLVFLMGPASSAAFIQPSSSSAAFFPKHRGRAVALTTMAAVVGGEGGSKATRRAALGQAAGLALLSEAVLGGGRAVAAEGAAAPEVTDRVYFDVAIGGESVGRLTFALFGKEAPQITGNFLKVRVSSIPKRVYHPRACLVTHDTTPPFPSSIPQTLIQILDGKAQGASYDYSSVFRVQKVNELGERRRVNCCAVISTNRLILLSHTYKTRTRLSLSTNTINTIPTTFVDTHSHQTRTHVLLCPNHPPDPH